MICDALEPYGIEGISVHFVSNVDGTDLSTTLENLNQETTLFVWRLRPSLRKKH